MSRRISNCTLAEINNKTNQTTPGVVVEENDTTGTTSFVEDISVTKASPNDAVDVTPIYFEQSGPEQTLSISKFMAKPFEIAAGQFAATDVAVTFTSWNFPYDLLSKDLYHRKLQGFLGFRGTLVLRLQVNAERFQQGRYMLCAVPTGGHPYEAKALDWFDMHAATRTQRSQLPHAEVDLGTETACELRLPFTMAQDFYSIQTMNAVPRPSTHIARIFPYEPLSTGSGGSPTAKYTLWAHYEDVELIGQALPVELQSRSLVKSSSKKKGKSASEQEADSEGVGPISSIAFKVGKAASYFNPLPMVGEFTTPLSWAANIVGNAASVFGWSAPVHVGAAHRYRQNNIPYAQNVNKVDMSMPLSLDVSNQVDVMPGVGITDLDELDIAYFASIPAYQDTFTWSTTDAENTLLTNYHVGLYPRNIVLSTVYGTLSTVTGYHYTPAQYLGSIFALYRGTNVFTFKFVKTEFHSGRISIEFNPVTKGYVSAAITDDVAPYVHRDVIDVRDLTEYVLEIPYISNVPYLTTDLSTESDYGRIDIRVIDPLVGPPSVNQSVQIIMEHSLGKDAEFAVLNKKLSSLCNGVVLQSRVVKTIGSMEQKTFQLETSKAAIGERVTNLRTLMKRYFSLTKAAVPADDTDALGSLYTLAPYSNSYIDISGDNRTVVKYNDLYGELAAIFCFSRGGVRAKAIAYTAFANQTYLKMYYVGANYTVTDVTGVAVIPEPNVWSADTITTNSTNYNIEEGGVSKWAEVQIPQYSMTHSRCNLTYNTSGLFPMTQRSDGLLNNIFVQAGDYNPISGDSRTRQPMNVRFMRSGADDSNFMFFISIPPMTRAGLGFVPV